MSGFFTKTETEGPGLHSRISGCGSCRIRRLTGVKPHTVTGQGKKGILIILESPDHLDKAEIKVLNTVLEDNDLDLERDCFLFYSVSCPVPGKKGPTGSQVKACRPNVLKAIEDLKPRMIWLMGTSALLSIIGYRWKKKLDGIQKWRGFIIPDRDFKTWICPLLHPRDTFKFKPGRDGHLERVDSPVHRVTLHQDIAKALEYLDRDYPTFTDESQYVQCLHDSDEIRERLLEISLAKKKISIDYETTGLKPQREGHRIVSVAIATSPTSAISFLYRKIFRDSLIQILQDPEIKKSATNLKFETNWSRTILGTRVRGWDFDPMLAAHILDQRQGITSLKFQTYVNFGVIDYSSHVDKFLQGEDEKDANSFNKVDQIPTRELLLYNGLDAIYDYKLSRRLKKRIEA